MYSYTSDSYTSDGYTSDSYSKSDLPVCVYDCTSDDHADSIAAASVVLCRRDSARLTSVEKFTAA
jgi:hypothetical protein